MDFQEAISKAQDAITVRVYGEPYERDGVVLIPAALIRGGGGGGGGGDATGGGSGSGGGFGLGARPVGAYVIEGGQVRWEPAVDVTRIALQVMLAALGVTFVLRRRHSDRIGVLVRQPFVRDRKPAQAPGVAHSQGSGSSALASMGKRYIRFHARQRDISRFAWWVTGAEAGIWSAPVSAKRERCTPVLRRPLARIKIIRACDDRGEDPHASRRDAGLSGDTVERGSVAGCGRGPRCPRHEYGYPQAGRLAGERGISRRGTQPLLLGSAHPVSGRDSPPRRAGAE